MPTSLDLPYGEFTVTVPKDFDCNDATVWGVASEIYNKIKHKLSKGDYQIKSFTPVVHNSKINFIEQEIEVGQWTIRRKLKIE